MKFQFFKNIFHIKQLLQRSKYFENIVNQSVDKDIDPRLDLQVPILQQIITNQKQLRLCTNFIADCLVMFIKKYGSKCSVHGRI